jgi:hypothetical protein
MVENFYDAVAPRKDFLVSTGLPPFVSLFILSLMSLKYGCIKASFAEMRSLWSNLHRLINRYILQKSKRLNAVMNNCDAQIKTYMSILCRRSIASGGA